MSKHFKIGKVHNQVTMSNYVLYFEIFIGPSKKPPINTIKNVFQVHIYLSFYGNLKGLYFFSKLVSNVNHESQKQCVINKRYFL